MFLDLREAGGTCSKHRVARLMRENKLRAFHGYRVRRWSAGKPAVLVPNLLQRQFTVTRPNKAWVTDITYIRTWQGWLYLAVVMDLFSRKVVGWAAVPSIARELVLDAVAVAQGGHEAIGCRHGAAGSAPRSFATSAGRFWITMMRVDGLLRTITNVRPSGDTS